MKKFLKKNRKKVLTIEKADDILGKLSPERAGEETKNLEKSLEKVLTRGKRYDILKFLADTKENFGG